MLKQRLTDSKFAQSVGFLTVANVLQGILGFTQGILVARWLGPKMYGIAALVMSYPALVYTFCDTRSSEASVKFLSEFHAKGDRDRALATCKVGYLTDVSVALLALLIVLATASWAALHVAHHSDANLLIVLFAAAYLPRAFVGTSNAVLTTVGLFPTIACLNVLVTVTRVGLILGFVLSGAQIAGVVWGNALAMAVEGLGYGAAALWVMRQKWGATWLSGRWKDLKGYRRSLLGFLAYNDLNALVGMIPKQLDIVLLGYCRNPTEVGYYKLAKSLAGVVGYVVGPLQSVTYPRLSALVAEQHFQEFRIQVRSRALSVGFPLAALSLFSIPACPFVIRWLLGGKYLPAIPATQVLLAGSVVWLAFFWLRPAFLALGEIKAWFCLTAACMVVWLVGMVIATRSWGYLGLASWMMLNQVWTHGLFAGWLFYRRRSVWIEGGRVEQDA